MSIARRIVMFFCSGFGAGYAPIAQGTIGSLLAIPIYFLFFDPFNNEGGWFAVLYLALTALWFYAGVRSCDVAEKILRKHDPGFAAIDEIVGYFLCLFLVPIHFWSIFWSFFLFRLFDITKPWPADRSQNLPGGWGVMTDDMLAAVYTNICLQILFRWWFG